MKFRPYVAVLLIVALLSGCTLQVQPTPPSNTEQPIRPVAEEPAVAEAEDTEPEETQADAQLEGRWKGTLSIADMVLEISVTFTQQEDLLTGTIDIPQQSAEAIPFNDIEVDLPNVHFEMLPAPQTAVFDGVLEDDTLSGTIMQSGFEGTFELVQAGDDVAPVEEEARYEDPEGLFSVPIPTNWSVEEYESYGLLTSPEAEIKVYVLAVPAESASEGIDAAWEIVDPEFDLELEETRDLPPSFPGIEESLSKIYDTESNDRIVSAGADLLEGIAYVLILDTELVALQQRSAQVGVIGSGFDIYALDETDLTGVAPQPLTDELLAEWESYIEEKMEQMDVPGAAVAVVRGDEVVYAEGFGVRNLDSEESVTPQTHFMIGSVTKTFTTMLMAVMVDAGLMDWDTPVVEVLPTFAVANPELSEQLTVRDLVCACTGVPRRDFEWLFAAFDLSAEEVIEQLEDYELFTEFGETFQYSNQMVSTGGYAAAAAAGAEWGNLYEGYIDTLEEQVLAPINMPNTTFSFEEVTERENYATPYGRDPYGGFYPLDLDVERTLLSIAPAGGLWSTLEDMTRYLRTEMNTGVAPDGTRVVSEENLSETWEPQVSITEDISYGLGWIVDQYKGVLVLYHDGNTFGFTTYLGFIPDADLGVVVMSNGRTLNLFSEAVRMRLLELLYDQPFEFEERLQFGLELTQDQTDEIVENLGEVDVDFVNPYLGIYTHPLLGEVSLDLVDGELVLDAGEFETTLLPYEHEDAQDGQHVMLEEPVRYLGVRFEMNEEGDRQIVLGGGVNEYVLTSAE